MKRVTQSLLSLSLVSLFFAQGLVAQQPTPAQIVIQAATAPTAPVTVKTTVQDGSSSAQAAIKALQKTKTINEELLKKQEAMLEQLDELQKAAEQLKIFSKRG